jgi:hypothetical protein
MASLNCITVSILGCPAKVSTNEVDKFEPQCPFRRDIGGLGDEPATVIIAHIDRCINTCVKLSDHAHKLSQSGEKKKKEDAFEPHIKQTCDAADAPSGNSKLDSLIPQDEGIATRAMHSDICRMIPRYKSTTATEIRPEHRRGPWG